VGADESTQQDEAWRAVLLGTDPRFRRRMLLKFLPSPPRCKICAAPFRGAGGPLMRLIGKEPWDKNPKYCGSCFNMLTAHHGGAEIPCSLLFADVRGSTTLAEEIGPAKFRARMDRFFDRAARVLIDFDAIVDKFAGDEVIGIFIPALAGQAHAARAVAAARGVLKSLAHDTDTRELPVGVGVHTGVAFVGAVGSGAHTELTALGDPVNVTARLASAAAAGEILVTVAAARAAGLDESDLEHRELDLKGKSESTSVVVLRA